MHPISHADMSQADQPSPRTLVVIVTYNGVKWLPACLGSLQASELPLSVVVVDNGSTDGTPAQIKAHYDWVRLIEPGENLGFGKGNNLGLQLALAEGYDYVFLLNQDAWIHPDTIRKMVEVHAQAPAYGVLSPVHLNGAGDKLDFQFSNYVVPDLCPGFYADAVLGVATKPSVYAAHFVNAAAWLISRDCLARVGGFDPIFPHYGEDIDYLDRAKFHGFQVGICPEVYIHHDREAAGLVTVETQARKYRHHNYVKMLARCKAPDRPLSRHIFREGLGALTFLLRGMGGKTQLLSGLVELRSWVKVLSHLGQLRAHRRISIHQRAAFLEPLP